MIVCAGDKENFGFAVPIGIGLVNSAINLTKLIIEKKPDKLLFVGTAGSYGEFRPLDTAISNVASNLEIGFCDRLSYSPIVEQIEGIYINVSHETLAKTVINSSNFITSNRGQAKLFLKYGLSLENMEFFSVLKAAKKFEIPTIGLFCVTNYCGRDAHEEFLKNHEKAKSILENVVKTTFKGFL